jgi:hypothetical protein
MLVLDENELQAWGLYNIYMYCKHGEEIFSGML